MARQTRSRMWVEETQVKDVKSKVQMHVDNAQVRRIFFAFSMLFWSPSPLAWSSTLVFSALAVCGGLYSVCIALYARCSSRSPKFSRSLRVWVIWRISCSAVHPSSVDVHEGCRYASLQSNSFFVAPFYFKKEGIRENTVGIDGFPRRCDSTLTSGHGN